MDTTEPIRSCFTAHTVERTLKAGDYVMILAKPWEEFIGTQHRSTRSRLSDMVWWGYKVLRVDHRGVQIESQTAPELIRRTVPAHCLERVVRKKKSEAINVPKVIPAPYPIGSKVSYLFNWYTIESIEQDADGMPLYNLTPCNSDLKVWKGDRVWHSLINAVLV